jgi:hypothetical protein
MAATQCFGGNPGTGAAGNANDGNLHDDFLSVMTGAWQAAAVVVI